MACNQCYPNNNEKTNKKDKTIRICSNRRNEIILVFYVSARHKHQLQTSVRCTSTLWSYLCYIFEEIADNNLKHCILE